MISDSQFIHEDREPWRQYILPVVLTIVTALPVFLFSYLPMTDLPQHLANLSILYNLNDPAFGFSQYYELDFSKTLYLVPYLVAWGLASVMSIDMALRCIVFISLIVYPLGLMAVLRLQRKPVILSLLAIPFVYNFLTFWGLINHNLAVGMAFFAFYYFGKENRSTREDIILTVLCIVITATHLYGTALIMGYAVLWGLFREGKITIRQYLPLVPCLVGVVLWSLMWNRGVEVGESPTWSLISDKIIYIRGWVMGGYQDSSESWILGTFVAIFLLFFIYGLRLNKKEAAQFFRADRLFYTYSILNFLAFLVLPLDVPSAKIIHPRHAVLAFCLLPLVIPSDFVRKLPVLGKTLLVGLALVSIGNTWFHLYLFDREARPFDSVIEHTPWNQRILQVNLDQYGEIMVSSPYLHYLTYIQAKKGGMVATGFAQYAWLAPLKVRNDAGVPITAIHFEWRPDFYDFNKFGFYYNYIVIRGYHPAADEVIKGLPYELAFEEPPWRLFRSTDTPVLGIEAKEP